MLEAAKEEFRSTFKDKTGNNWASRAKFQKLPGKFNLVDVRFSKQTCESQRTGESQSVSAHRRFVRLCLFGDQVDYSGADDDLGAVDSDAPSKSKLDIRVQEIVKTFFNVQDIRRALASMEIDTQKMPLGKLSRAHIQSGYAVLSEIQNAIQEQPTSEAKLLALSNKFYTIIPV